MIRLSEILVDYFWLCRYSYLTQLSVLSTFSLRYSVNVFFFFFWLRIVMVVDYFQAVQMLLVFSFLWDFFPDISLYIFYQQIVSYGFFFSIITLHRIGINLKYAQGLQNTPTATLRRGKTPSPTNVLDMTQNNLMTIIQ